MQKKHQHKYPTFSLIHESLRAIEDVALSKLHTALEQNMNVNKVSLKTDTYEISLNEITFHGGIHPKTRVAIKSEHVVESNLLRKSRHLIVFKK